MHAHTPKPTCTNRDPPALHQLLEEAEEDVGVEAALMRLIQDDHLAEGHVNTGTRAASQSGAVAVQQHMWAAAPCCRLHSMLMHGGAAQRAFVPLHGVVLHLMTHPVLAGESSEVSRAAWRPGSLPLNLITYLIPAEACILQALLQQRPICSQPAQAGRRQVHMQGQHLQHRCTHVVLLCCVVSKEVSSPSTIGVHGCGVL